MAKSNKGITRIEYEGVSSKGWLVRICRAGERKQRFFSDKTHGTKAKALALAKVCYEDWLAKAGPIKTAENVKTARNSSGTVGVHLVHSVDERWANAESYAYCASWVTDDGKRQKLSFAWTRYGKKAAWELACLAREKRSTDREALLKMVEKKSGKKVKKAKKAK
jgi:hypothetical protein